MRACVCVRSENPFLEVLLNAFDRTEAPASTALANASSDAKGEVKGIAASEVSGESDAKAPAAAGGSGAGQQRALCERTFLLALLTAPRKVKEVALSHTRRARCARLSAEFLFVVALSDAEEVR